MRKFLLAGTSVLLMLAPNMLHGLTLDKSDEANIAKTTKDNVYAMGNSITRCLISKQRKPTIEKNDMGLHTSYNTSQKKNY